MAQIENDEFCARNEIFEEGKEKCVEKYKLDDLFLIFYSEKDHEIVLGIFI